MIGFRRWPELLRSGSEHPGVVISIWHKFHPPPWGGGNQFLLALRTGLLRQGIAVRENDGRNDVAAHILHSVWFDASAFRGRRNAEITPVIHRLDGPVCLYRADGSGKDLDEQCFALNAEFASVTVFQSKWSLEQNLALGYRPVNPMVIFNAADPEIFHTQGRIPFSRSRKMRLISTSWSSNPGKGADTYKWLEEHLDWSRFEYTFVGNAPVQFSRIRRIPPVPSPQLADLLRQHDVFITASRNDPCSNSLVEALTCGLPALFLNSGGHPELVRGGGLPFETVDEILPQLDRLVADYDAFQARVSIPRISDVARRYLQAAGIELGNDMSGNAGID